MASTRPSREEILELFKACQTTLGKPPGTQVFCKMAKLKPAEVTYYWPRHSALVREAGSEPQEFGSKYSDDEVFADFARVCQHLAKVPSQNELRIAQRELKTKTSTVYSRYRTIEEFQNRFRNWLECSNNEFKKILHFDGWSRSKTEDIELVHPDVVASPYLHPFLPGTLQYLEVIARGEMPPYEASDLAVSTLFERRTADAFRCLGFEIQHLGQGTGRNPDVIALARREGIWCSN